MTSTEKDARSAGDGGEPQVPEGVDVNRRDADVPAVFQVPREQMEALAGPMSDGQVAMLRRYGRLLLEHAQKMSLVSKHELSRLGVHFVDSAALLAHRDLPGDGGGVTADLGTGAGLPGVVLAILRPDAHVALVDSRRSRIVFLKIVERELELENIEIIHERIEALRGKRAFELCVARALGKIEDVLVPSLGVVAPGGALVLFKGPKWQDERARAGQLAAGAGAKLSTERTVELPSLDRATTFAEFSVAEAG